MVAEDTAPPTVVAFAPTDPSGGAGLQADILTLHALGCHALAVSTGTTSQDADRLADFVPAGPALLRRQFASVAKAARRARVAKAGATGPAASVRAVADLVRSMGSPRLVLDPVMAPSGGAHRFASARDIRSIRRHLLPRVEVLTPNSEEAKELGGRPRADDAARALIDAGCAHVLVSSHAQRGKTLVARLHGRQGMLGEWPLSRRPECHGTGCTLASAIAARLAFGHPVADSVAFGLNFAYDSVVNSYAIPGLGRKRIPRRLPPGPVHQAQRT